MNPQVKEKWVKALRSNEYKQGTGLLRNGDRFCCLGVLCDIYAKEHPDQTIVTGQYFGHNSFLPNSIREWAELPSIRGAIVVIAGLTNTLDKQNDCNFASFQQIAEAIDNQL